VQGIVPKAIWVLDDDDHDMPKERMLKRSFFNDNEIGG
jgi:hypothetical protein